jgi:hypothetical protein
MVGAAGIVGAVMLFDGDDAVEFPTWFLATTVNVYEVPEISPVTVIVPLPELET